MPSIEATIEKLQSLHKELTHRIEKIDIDVHHKNDPVEKDFAEQVTQRENDDVLTAIDEESQYTVKLIDAALIRIKEGSYGICTQCGEKIPDARLEALPYAITCVSCTE